MRYVAAYMLAVMGGIENPTADDMKMIIGSVGVDSENDKIDLVISKLRGKNVEELVAESQHLLASVCASGPIQSAVAPVGEKQEIKEEKKEETKSDSDDDSDGGGLMNLFDD